MTESMKDTLARMKPQSDEFDAAQNFAQAFRNLPPIVDDDYPGMRSKYEGAAYSLITAFINNGRMDNITSMHPPKGFSPIHFDQQVAEVTRISIDRCKRWHGDEGLDDWSVLEWAGAMCGEAGEAANVAKKILRVVSGMQSIGNAGLTRDDLRKLDAKLAQECADVFLYLVLLAAKRNINLGEAIRNTFNTKSIEYSFPERL